MNTQILPQKKLEDVKVNIKIKLSSIWTSIMFLIIYLDYFHLYMPNSLKDMLNGKVYVFDISQGFLLAALIMIAIPSIMIFLSIVLKARINRTINILAASINIPLLLFNLAGTAWIHMIIGAAIQITLLVLIVIYSWKWPQN